MRLWGYYAWHTFWNTIKKMFRSTFLVIILAIFGFGIIFGLIGGVVGSMVEKQQSLETVESSSEADRVQEEAMEEAQRCLGCKKPKCVEGCPVSINIPGFIEQIKEGNIEEAYKAVSYTHLTLPTILLV